MTHVWKYSEHSGGALLMLLAYADYANDDGECWPKMQSIAAKSRLSIRQSKRVKSILLESGELKVVKKSTGRNDPDRVKVIIERVTPMTPQPGITGDILSPQGQITGDNMSPQMGVKGDMGVTPGVTFETKKGDAHDTPGVTPMSPPIYEPSDQSSLDPSDQSSSSSKSDDDDDDFQILVNLLCSEFSLTSTETIRAEVSGWLSENPATKIEGAIRRAAKYNATAPLPYISGILRNGDRKDPYIGRKVPSDMSDIVIGI